MTLLAALVFLVCVSCVSISEAFVLPGATRLQRSVAVYMGRSPQEAATKASQRTMFKDMRDKLNKAAEIPGFFDVGDGPPEVDFFCKSSKDGKQVGDCPYAQFVQMVMKMKGIRYNTYPCLPDSKPDWLVSKFEGKMPALKHKDTTLVDSLAIAEYLEKTFPHTSLTKQGAYSYQEVIEKTNGFFPAVASYIKNKDASKDPELFAAVNAQLDIIDEILRSAPGPYLCGMDLTLADLYLTPQLFHAVAAIDHFKNEEIYVMGEGDPMRPALERFMMRMFSLEEFNDKKVYYTVDAVIYGWKVARGDA